MRRNVIVFTALVILLTWAVAAPFFFGADPDLLMVVIPLGMFVPLITATATWLLVDGRRPAFGEVFATRRFGPGLLLTLGVFAALAALQPLIATALGLTSWVLPGDPAAVAIAFAAQLGIMLIASIGEELAWRGWLFSMLRPRGFWFTAIVSSVIWSVWHAPILAISVAKGLDSPAAMVLSLVSVLMFGPLFAALREVSGSVWPAVLAHALMNSLFLAVDEHFVAPVEGWARVGWLAVIWALSIAATLLLLAGHRRRLAARAAEDARIDRRSGATAIA